MDEESTETIADKPDQIANIDIQIPSLNSAATAKPNISVQTLIVIIVLSLIVIGLFGSSIWFAMNKQITDLRSENEELTKSITSLKKSNAVTSNNTVTDNSNSIITSKTTMYQVDGFTNASWLQSKSIDPERSDILLSNTAINATLAPAVVDIDLIGENYTLSKYKYWVAVGIKSVDNRTTGSKRAIIERDNIRLVENGNKIPPVVVRENLIAPLESKTVYAFFPVEKASTSFELWTGDMTNPTINKLNFTNGTKLNGYFLIDRGYSSTLK